jgi:uncharacterized repeat protein (TIGR03843 family)
LTDPVPTLLRDGRLAVEGRLVAASNATLLCRLVDDGARDAAETTLRCVYKPIAGERPLWDFPDGTLALREVAAFLVSEAAGWHVVPPTVLRDGPHGPGMCQLWVDHDGAALVGVADPDHVPTGWLPVLDALDGEGNPVVLVHADDPRLRRMALFDLVVNNADRKGGHVLVDGDRVVGVDHGVCFHIEAKLRTVLWGWVGRPFTPAEQDRLAVLRASFDTGLEAALTGLITAEEITATNARLDRLIGSGRFPRPDPTRMAIPWPPF